MDFVGSQDSEGELFTAPQHTAIGQLPSHHHCQVAHLCIIGALWLTATVFKAQVFKYCKFAAHHSRVDAGGKWD